MKILSHIVIIMIFSLGILSSLAQDDLTTTFEFPDSSVNITYPEKWEIAEAEDGRITLSTESYELRVYDSVALETAFDFVSAESVDDALITLAPQLLGEDIEFDEDQIMLETVSERDLARIDVDSDDDTLTVIVLMMSDDTFGLLHSISPTDDVLTNEPLLMDILETFDSVDEGGFSFDIDTSAISEAFCNISTSEANTIQVRVGPGTNRTVVSFLPANVELAVLGKSETDDGSLWFKLDKEEAAPGKAVNETWILAENVMQDGNCSAVADVAAPPIIPIIVQPTPNPDGTEETPEFIIPSDGSWRFSADTIFVTCPNGIALSVPSGVPPQTFPLSGGGASDLIVDDDAFPMVAPNTYNFSDTLIIEGEAITANMTFIVMSETSISGSMVFTIEGCQGTAPFEMVRL